MFHAQVLAEPERELLAGVAAAMARAYSHPSAPPPEVAETAELRCARARENLGWTDEVPADVPLSGGAADIPRARDTLPAGPLDGEPNAS
jgi:hypothetical protein